MDFLNRSGAHRTPLQLRRRDGVAGIRADLAGYTFDLQLFAGPLSVVAMKHKHAKHVAAIFTVLQMQPFFFGQLRPFLGHFEKMFLNEMHDFSSHLSKNRLHGGTVLYRDSSAES